MMVRVVLRERLAWAAGMLDGDGTIVVSRSRYISVHLGSTDPRLLARFRASVGMGNVTGPYSHRHPGRWSRKPQYFFQAYAGGVDLLDALWFVLGSAKRRQACAAASQIKDSSSPRQIPDFLLSFSTGDNFHEMSRRERLAWAAGFFEAEGCISHSKRSGVCVSITQTDTEVLERFRAALGLGRIYGPYTSKHGDGISRKPHYFYRATGHHHTQAIVAMIWTWLGDEKRRQAVAALNRVLVCQRGHLKVAGERGCSLCRVEQWREWRLRRGLPAAPPRPARSAGRGSALS